MKKFNYVIMIVELIIILVLGFGFYKLAVQNKGQDPTEKVTEETVKESTEELTEDKKEEAKEELEESVEPVENLVQREVSICIDPGHYGGVNRFEFEDGSSYCEGDSALAIAKELKRILDEEYGIYAYMTRETDDITIDGYSNETLDKTRISLRGEAAKGADLFLSIHTNANNEGANGCDTLMQPEAINKPFVFVNVVGENNPECMEIANLAGKNLSALLYENLLATVDHFSENRDGNNLMEWTDSYNDALDVPGTVCCRMNKDQDYYGVLRGASAVAVPGMIIEHGFHTVPVFREAMRDPEFIEELAEADAKAIAEGFGIKEKE